MNPKTKYQPRIQSSTTHNTTAPATTTNPNISAASPCIFPTSLELHQQTNKQTNMPTISNFYTMQEASLHNTKDDCWIVVDGKVYDVTQYLDDHPGGDDVLIAATGKDATDDFEDAGHSKTARELMAEYYIGELDTSPPPLTKEPVSEKFMQLRKQYLAASVALVGISVVVGFLYLRKK